MKSIWHHIAEGIRNMLTFGGDPLYEEYKRMGLFNDYDSIASHWQKVGDYLREAMGQIDKENGGG